MVSSDEEELEAKVKAATVDEELVEFPVPLLPPAGGVGVGVGAGFGGGVFPDGEPVPPFPVPDPLFPVLELLPVPEEPVTPELPLPLSAIAIPFPGRPRGEGVGFKFGAIFGGRMRGRGVEPEEPEFDATVPSRPRREPVLEGNRDSPFRAAEWLDC